MNESFSRLLKISSSDRLPIQGQSNSDFSINVPANSVSLNSVVGVQVVACSIPNIFDNIHEFNDVFTYTISDGTEYSITFPHGHYDSDTLLGELVTQLTTQLGGGDACEYTIDPISNVVIITTPGFDITVQDTELATEYLGFSINQTSISNVLTAVYPINLSYPDCVFVHSRQLSQGTTDFDMSHCILAVPMEKAYGYVNHFQSTSDTSNLMAYNALRKFNQISLTLRDFKGRVLDIKGFNWSILIKVYYNLN